MKKACGFLCVAAIAATALASCDSPTNGAPDPRVRVSVESTGTANADIRVCVEGKDGDSVSGAVVQVTDSANRVENLAFDADSCCYTASRSILPDGVLSFRVDSVLFSVPYELTVSHVQLSEKPTVTVFLDASGNSVLSGQTLDRSEPIQIGWSDSGEGVVYSVTLRTATTAYYAASTEARTLTIPAGAFPSGGTYYASLSAQRIRGDPYFVTENYYSVSNSGATNVYCTVQ